MLPVPFRCSSRPSPPSPVVLNSAVIAGNLLRSPRKAPLARSQSPRAGRQRMPPPVFNVGRPEAPKFIFNFPAPSLTTSSSSSSSSSSNDRPCGGGAECVPHCRLTSARPADDRNGSFGQRGRKVASSSTTTTSATATSRGSRAPRPGRPIECATPRAFLGRSLSFLPSSSRTPIRQGGGLAGPLAAMAGGR